MPIPYLLIHYSNTDFGQNVHAVKHIKVQLDATDYMKTEGPGIQNHVRPISHRKDAERTLLHIGKSKAS